MTIKEFLRFVNAEGRQVKLTESKPEYWYTEYEASIICNICLCFTSIACAIAFASLSKYLNRQGNENISIIREGFIPLNAIQRMLGASNRSVYNSILLQSTSLVPIQEENKNPSVIKNIKENEHPLLNNTKYLQQAIISSHCFEVLIDLHYL